MFRSMNISVRPLVAKSPRSAGTSSKEPTCGPYAPLCGPYPPRADEAQLVRIGASLACEPTHHRRYACLMPDPVEGTRVSPPTVLPTGTVTFLMTDIEGSTRLLQALGESYPELLADHHRLLRKAFGSAGVEVSTEGDALFFVFHDAPSAIRAALEGQRRLTAHAWPDDAAVRVRMGIHSGEGRLLDVDYVGLDVHRVARITNAGHGG